MAVCPNCNNPVEDGFAFCAFCGESIPASDRKTRICSNCNSEIGDDHTFCPYCGAKIEDDSEKKNICPGCNAELEADYSFCPFCGTSKITDAPKEPSGDAHMYTCPNCNSIVKPYNGLCPFCATEILGHTSATQEKISETASTPKRRKLHCPMCKSYNFSVVTESSISTGITTSRGNISGTVFANEHKQFWICHDCGTKFRNIQSLEEEIQGERSITNIFKFTFYFILILCGITFFGMLFPFADSNVMMLFFILMAIGDIITLILWSVFDKRLTANEEELERLREECFD